MTSCLQSLLDRYSAMSIYGQQDGTNGVANARSKNTEATTHSQSADIRTDMKSGNASHADSADLSLIYSRRHGKSLLLRLLQSLEAEKFRNSAKKQSYSEHMTQLRGIVRLPSYRVISVDESTKLTLNLIGQFYDPEDIGHGQSVQAEDARNAGPTVGTRTMGRDKAKRNRKSKKGRGK